MSVRTSAPLSATPGPSPTRLAWARRSSLAVLVLLVMEYGLGMYVNLYVAVPAADHGGSLGGAIAEGPALLSVHATVGLLLGLGAIAALVHAARARRRAVTVLSAAGLLAVIFAAVAGSAFTSTGDTADSMAMSVMTGIALLCYAVSLYRLGVSAANQYGEG